MTSPQYAAGTAAAATPTAPPPPPLPVAVAVATEIPDHRGEPRLPHLELFGMPPPEIGRILSVESTLKAGGRVYPTWLRPVLVVVVGIAVLVAVMYLWPTPRRGQRDNATLVALVAGCLAGAVTWYAARHSFGQRCSYVGEHGVALFELRRGRSSPPRASVLLFAHAVELRAKQVRQFVNGVYSGTEYDYRWTDPAGRLLLKLRGRYMGKDKPPKPGDPFHFASAAEIAWSNHYLARAASELEQTGAISFRVDGKRFVRVGPGFIEFHNFGGETVRVTKDEIAKVTLGGGTFAFVHKDAKWYRSAGKYKFQYGQMANGKVFFLALDKLMGYRWN